ncbi:MAG TPA: alpha/beta fold hydrolase [Desulfitobacteriaceae bacterium]|nr:alpha/beta fold hydrolase [Desulfitobacteriaceae bacterium]
MDIRNIVLIHGWASDESIWKETRKYLEQKYRVYALNLAALKQLPDYCEQVSKLIEENALEQVLVTGWSLGALVALQTAIRLPAKVQGLLLISGTSKFLSAEQYPGGIPAALVKRMKKRLNNNARQTFSDFHSLMFSKQEQTQGIAAKITANYLSRGRTWDIAEARAGLDFLIETDLRSDLKDITCPVLLLHGEQDEICPLGGAVYLEQQLPCARLVSYPETGHMPFLTNSKDFQRDLEGWLSVYGK